MGQEEERDPGATSPSGSDGPPIIMAPIQVIVPTFDHSDDEDAEQTTKKKKRKVKKKKAKEVVDEKANKTLMLTKTFGQAMRLINEQKVRYIAIMMGIHLTRILQRNERDKEFDKKKFVKWHWP